MLWLTLLSCTDVFKEGRLVVKGRSRDVVEHDPTRPLPYNTLDALDRNLLLCSLRNESASQRMPGEIADNARGCRAPSQNARRPVNRAFVSSGLRAARTSEKSRQKLRQRPQANVREPWLRRVERLVNLSEAAAHPIRGPSSADRF